MIALFYLGTVLFLLYMCNRIVHLSKTNIKLYIFVIMNRCLIKGKLFYFSTEYLDIYTIFALLLNRYINHRKDQFQASLGLWTLLIRL